MCALFSQVFRRKTLARLSTCSTFSPLQSAIKRYGHKFMFFVLLFLFLSPLIFSASFLQSLLTLSNAALLFAPMFLSHDVSSDRKRADLLAGSSVKKTGFTPLFSRRRQTSTPGFAMEVEAVDLKELMSAGVNVVSMLLVNFREIWLRFSNARPFALVRAVKESGPARATDEIEYKKGATIGMFLKLPDGVCALGECNGKVGRFVLANTKTVEIE